jgi:hypothetical protein
MHLQLANTENMASSLASGPVLHCCCIIWSKLVEADTSGQQLLLLQGFLQALLHLVVRCLGLIVWLNRMRPEFIMLLTQMP